MLQVLVSDLDLPRARSAGITIVMAVLVLPLISLDSFIVGQPGVCQRLPAAFLAFLDGPSSLPYRSPNL